MAVRNYYRNKEQEASPLPAPAPIPPTTSFSDILDMSRIREPESESEPRRERSDSYMASAPPSRYGTPGSFSAGPGRMVLTKAQAEIAALSGISNRTYWENLQIMEQMKKNGTLQQ
jgi:hypothetical protein